MRRKTASGYKIDNVTVDHVYVKDGRCLHRVAADGDQDGEQTPFVTEQEVVVSLDWPRRFDHMQQHSAQHLLSAIAKRYRYDTTTWSLGEERCNVELVWMDRSEDDEEADKKKRVISDEVLQKIENDVKEAIAAGLAMTPSFAEPGTDEWNNIAAKFESRAMP